MLRNLPTRHHIRGDFNDQSNRIQSYLAVLVIALTAVIPYILVTALLSGVYGPRVETCNINSIGHTGLSAPRPGFDPRSVHARHGGQWHCASFLSQNFSFSLPASSHQRSTCILLRCSYKDKWAEPGNLPKSSAITEIGELCMEMYGRECTGCGFRRYGEKRALHVLRGS